MTPQSNAESSTGFGLGGLLVGPAFFALAAWFIWDPEIETIPIPEPTPIHADHISTAPRRTILGDPPVIRLNSFDRTCMECHRAFQSPNPVGCASAQASTQAWS